MLAKLKEVSIKLTVGGLGLLVFGYVQALVVHVFPVIGTILSYDSHALFGNLIVIGGASLVLGLVLLLTYWIIYWAVRLFRRR